MPTPEEVRDVNMANLAAAHAVYVEAVREVFGSEGLEVIREANRLRGLDIGREAIRNGELREHDLESIFHFFERATPFFGFGLELVSVDDRHLELKVTRCPWLDTFQTMAQEDICEWVCAMDEGIGQAVDPELRFTLPRCMMRGDPWCIYRWEK